MPIGNVTWSDMTPEEQAKMMRDKARADAMEKPKPLSNPSGGQVGINFSSLKAYATRMNRSLYSKS